MEPSIPFSKARIGGALPDQSVLDQIASSRPPRLRGTNKRRIVPPVRGFRRGALAGTSHGPPLGPRP